MSCRHFILLKFDIEGLKLHLKHDHVNVVNHGQQSRTYQRNSELEKNKRGPNLSLPQTFSGNPWSKSCKKIVKYSTKT